jgi:uncharacterized protein (TIGR02145 family)
MGTPMYMSPEQIKSTKDVTLQSDIYSLGVVLWQMVTGKKPYDLQTLSTFELQTKIVNEKLDKTHSIWDVQIQKASTKNLEERFQQCHAWLREMNKIFSVDSPAPIPIADDKTVLANKVHEDATQIEKQTKNTEDINAQTVTIGSQVWTSKNLNVDKFRNGDPIPEARTDEEWLRAGENQQPAWCYYDNDPNNGTKYGKLYNWFAVNDPRGLAPNGFHIPSYYTDWMSLTNYLGGEVIAGKKMKSASGWSKKGNGTNGSGFSGIPGGCRWNIGVFANIGTLGFWWTTENTTDSVLNLFLHCSDGSVHCSYDDKKDGYSVRCLRD